MGDLVSRTLGVRMTAPTMGRIFIIWVVHHDWQGLGESTNNTEKVVTGFFSVERTFNSFNAAYQGLLRPTSP